MREHRDRISLEDCIEGHVYRLLSRNLAFGVFRRNEGKVNGPGFIGIRLKFSNRYLFEEYHWDTGVPFGTANPMEDLGPVPEGILLSTDIHGVSDPNTALFEYLDDNYEKELPADYDSTWVEARVQETYAKPYTEQRKGELERQAARKKAKGDGNDE